MLSKRWASAAVLTFLLMGFLGGAQADKGGIVQGVSKQATKGIVKGVQQELSTGELVQRAKDITKGVTDGVADAAPLLTSQILNQASVNRKAIGRVARQASAEAVAGALSATVREVDQALGPEANGPLAGAVAATTERVTAAAARGLVSEVRLDPETTERLTAAAVRGAVSELHFHVRIWPLAIAFVLGGISTFLCALGLLLLYTLFERKHPLVVEAPPRPSTRPPTRYEGLGELAPSQS